MRVSGRAEGLPVPHAKMAVAKMFRENGAKQLRTTTPIFRVFILCLRPTKSCQQIQMFPINLVRISPVSGSKRILVPLQDFSDTFRHVCGPFSTVSLRLFPLKWRQTGRDGFCHVVKLDSEDVKLHLPFNILRPLLLNSSFSPFRNIA